MAFFKTPTIDLTVNSVGVKPNFRAFWKILFKICSLPFTGMLPGCLPEQLPGLAGPSLGACESDRLHLWDENGSEGGMSVGTWVLTCYRESYGHACWR